MRRDKTQYTTEHNRMDNNRNMLLTANEKAYVKQIRSHLIFESGFCTTARKYSVLPKIYKQMRSVFEQKFCEVDITKEEYLGFLPRIPTLRVATSN